MSCFIGLPGPLDYCAGIRPAGYQKVICALNCRMRGSSTSVGTSQRAPKALVSASTRSGVRHVAQVHVALHLDPLRQPHALADAQIEPLRPLVEGTVRREQSHRGRAASPGEIPAERRRDDRGGRSPVSGTRDPKGSDRSR